MDRSLDMPGDDDSAARRRASLTDSPWFWVELFAISGVLGLLVVSGKYQVREARLEQRFEARQNLLLRPAAGPGEPKDPDSWETPPDQLRQPLLVSLRPLFVLLIGVWLVAHGVRLFLTWRARRGAASALP